MSNRSRIGRYKVRIYAISCEDLSAKDKGGKSDPYCMFDFDKYRKFNTPVSLSSSAIVQLNSHFVFKVQKKTLNPVYDTDEEFNYATQYADRLQFKHLIINIHDKDFWGKEYIGSAKVDLHTLLTGPEYKTNARISHETGLPGISQSRGHQQGTTGWKD
eukprot:734311-Amorphochlora_amoeboformis.AAC.2